ncbi:MAG: transposase [Deltaproteobacteria bacterium]|nr:transposase [Deltaproteobacteria bacterium]
MLWKVPTKLSAEEQRLVARMRKPSRFFVFLREIRAELFTPEFQEELARAYEPRGQEPVPPALLAMVVLLQAYTQTSDAAAVEEAEMNPRWQLVLGLLGEEKAPFGQGSLPRFRERMAAHDLDRRLLERTVELAKRTGGFGWQKLKAAFDSSPLRGRGRVADTWNLIGQAMVSSSVHLRRSPRSRRTRSSPKPGSRCCRAAASRLHWTSTGMIMTSVVKRCNDSSVKHKRCWTGHAPGLPTR